MTGTAPASRWLVRRRRDTPPARRLLCLPHAGAGAAAYARWPALVPAAVEVVAVRLPGRESRYGEEPPVDIDTVVEALVPEVLPLLDRPTVVFGYSMGALIGYRLAVALERQGAPAIGALVVGGHESPTRPRRAAWLHDLPDADFVRAIVELGGTPPEVFDHPGLFDMLAPVLRADLRLVETHPRETELRALRTPLLVYRGRDDAGLDPDGVEAWRETTAAEPRFRTFPGGHFDMLDDPAELIAALCNDVGLAG